MKLIPAKTIADYLLANVQEHGDYLTNLKLQKLLYYTQAWHLALHNKPLFPEEIQARAQGPTVPEVYKHFEKFKYAPITTTVTKPSIPRQAAKLIDEVLEKYACLSGWDLEIMTQQENPWKAARGNLPKDINSDTNIGLDSIKHFFQRKLHGQKPKNRQPKTRHSNKHSKLDQTKQDTQKLHSKTLPSL
jgi:uncharacterized phage-associated protein